ncbi:uncharacterized protein LOC134275462 isoform X1 [Saccostrea cucullata]|uniref:uncharacterized protein LOC134275462 isoform X1 n=1 Tax=Saccostrea cuccullata TaxID=36930 RepID=UPI002ED56DF3
MSSVILFMLAILFGESYSQGTGIVYIGVPNNSSLPTFTVTNSIAGGVTIDVPVYIDAVNNTVSESINGNVDVTCEMLVTTRGFSSATFSTRRLSDTTRSGTVQMNNLQTGRVAAFQCFGESVTAGVNQFTRAGSRSRESSLTVISPPTISICAEDTIKVLNTNTAQQSFTVEFSDQVTTAVTVSCTRENGTMVLNIPNNVAQVGTTRLQMDFTLTTVGTPVQVLCSATGYSTGPSVVFQMNEPNLAFYPPPFTTTATKFGLLLLVTNPPTATIPVTCQANLYSSSAAAQGAINNPPCGASPTATTTTAATTTGSSVSADPNATTPAPIPSTTLVPSIPEWGFLLNAPAIENTNNYLQIKVARNLATTSFVREYVVVSCCTTNLPNRQLQVATMVVAELNKNRTIDWTNAAAQVSVDSETPYKNPAFVNISPCPCDITQNACDMDCCCDSDCTTSDRDSFRACISGLPGGQSAPYPEYYCQSSHPLKEDWFPLMCVEREYNALIGFFYAASNTLRNTEALNLKVASESFYSYSRPDLTTTQISAYKTGVSVKSIKESAVGGGAAARIGTVVLPRRILAGQCLTTAPVRYLVDQQSDCTFTVTRDMCNSASVFSALFYIQSSTTRDPSCPNAFSVQGSPSDSVVTETNVNYFCTSDFSGYVKDTSSIGDVTTSTFFNFTLPTDQECLDVCGNYICVENVPVDVTEPTRGSRCSFDNGYTRPPVPFVRNNVCENVVLDVKYDFQWKGTRIVKLDATVILGNVPLSTTTAPVEITQKYEANFNYQYESNGTIASDNYREVNTAYDRSTGYNLGKTLNSGVQINNVTENTFLYINTNQSQQIAVWDTGADSLCFNAGRKLIEFGQDVFTSCLVKLSLQDLRNCSNIRKTLINRLNNLMKADKIGRLGNNNYLNLAYWIDVAREDISAVCTGYLNSVDDATNNSKLSYEAQGLCVDIISGIHLDVMYAITGKLNATPIHEVIGARISYVKSEWHLRCAIGDMNACNTPGYAETFEVTSSVRFILVPGNTPERLPRYKDSKYYDTCSQDVCWEAFIYPLSSSYEGVDKEQVLVQVLLVIVILVGFLVFLRPWWYIL